MILGLMIKPESLIFGGSLLLLLLLFQVLVGMRKIKFNGSLHMKVHKYAAWAILALGFIHGLLGTVYGLQSRLG